MPRPRCEFWLARGLSLAAVDDGRVGHGEAWGRSMMTGLPEGKAAGHGKDDSVMWRACMMSPFESNNPENPNHHACFLVIPPGFLSGEQAAARGCSYGLALPQVPHSCLPRILTSKGFCA
jgi:hypothetical protein